MGDPKNGVTVHANPEGDYSILAPTHDGDDAPKTRYRVFGMSEFIFLDVAEDRIVFGPTVQLCMDPFTAHALAEALHAKANALEGKPADAPFPPHLTDRQIDDLMDEPAEIEEAIDALGPIFPPTFI